jgi:hypothetical protein
MTFLDAFLAALGAAFLVAFAKTSFFFVAFAAFFFLVAIVTHLLSCRAKSFLLIQHENRFRKLFFFKMFSLNVVFQYCKILNLILIRLHL